MEVILFETDRISITKIDIEYQVAQINDEENKIIQEDIDKTIA